MGMLGTLYPKFIYDHNGPDEEEVLLPHAQYDTNEPDTKYLEHESEIDLEREFVKLGTHRIIKFPYLLYKEASPSEKYQTFMLYHGLSVSLWLHSDGPQFKKSDGMTDALFVLKEVKHYEDAVYRDYCELTFESINPVGDLI